MSNASPAWRECYQQAARDAAFLLRLWPTLLLAFLAVVPLIVLGVGTAVIGIGVPVLVLGLSVSSHFAQIGRRAVADVDSSEYIPGHYRHPEVGAQGARPLLVPLHDPQRWADLTWVVVGFVVSLATWTLAPRNAETGGNDTRNRRKVHILWITPVSGRLRPSPTVARLVHPAGLLEAGSGLTGPHCRAQCHSSTLSAPCEQGPTARVGAPRRRLAILPRRPATATSRSAKRGGLPERPMGADCKSAAVMLRGFESLTRHYGHRVLGPGGQNRSPRGTPRGERGHGGRSCSSDSRPPRVPLVAPIAQSAERLHGKEKVKGSIPFRGSNAAGADGPRLC